ncbi:testicular acid phosphatase homolog isoform X1 [Homalodisca vitripennis]|uniref:testicular acid phosphatase homolog isoform X1 n=1 Tax=Homalodisca vitripennis TaxID=197043 RepID=UPI001EEBA65E|nr:testicular acid phosphatase homolog isoform X1 [Homalodisca vitripennis]
MSRGFYFFSTVAVLVLAVAHKQTSEPFPVDKDVFNSTPTSPTNTTGTRTTATLQLVIVFTRHGSRGPGFAYPTSPYQPQDTTYWPNGWTELTDKGHLQMYTLGKKFRSLYDGFLEEIYSPKDFQANSTLLERTMMSASLFLAGLFPSRDLHLYNTYFPWNTVPIYPTYKDHHDVAYITGAQKCPKSHAAWIEAVGRFRDDYKHNITEFLEFVGPYTGIDLAESFNSTESIWMAIYTMWESIYTVIEEGLPLPSWTDKIYPQPLTFLADQLLRASSAGSDTQIRYVEGEYFKVVVSLMKAKIEGTLRPERRMFYFSGHDLTLLGLQGVLGLAQDPSGRLNARTGSALIIELHKNLQSKQFLRSGIVHRRSLTRLGTPRHQHPRL